MTKISFSLTSFIEKRWYGRPGVLCVLIPLERLFIALAKRRRARLQAKAYVAKLPLVVVGNIAVGGTGKTPLIIALLHFLQQQGYTPAVVSRGYGSRASKSKTPVVVNGQQGFEDVGDEPLEIFHRSGCRVIVGGDRVAAVQLAEATANCDIILADDGLQHYRLGRNVEIVVVDGQRIFGNGHCLPVGPLRELPARMNDAEFCLVNNPQAHSLAAIKKWCSCFDEKLFDEKSLAENNALTGEGVKCFTATVQVSGIVNLKTRERRPASALAEETNLVAVAGIGNPAKFFSTLKALGLTFSSRIFSDHHPFSENDLHGLQHHTIVMTGKDAIKCHAFARENMWVLEVYLAPDPAFLDAFNQTLVNLRESK